MSFDKLFDGSDAHKLCGPCGGTGILVGSECWFCDGKNALQTVIDTTDVPAPSNRDMSITEFLAAEMPLADEMDDLADYFRQHEKPLNERLMRTVKDYLIVAARAAIALRAAPSQQAPSTAAQEPIPTLMNFYDVGTLEDLAIAQSRHIEKLQSKLPPQSGSGLPPKSRFA